MAPESTPKPKSVALDTEEEEGGGGGGAGGGGGGGDDRGRGVGRVHGDPAGRVWRRAAGQIQHHAREERGGGATDQGLGPRAADDARGPRRRSRSVSCARARSGRGWSSSRLRESFNGFGVRGGTKAEFDAIKDAMLDGEPPLPTDVEAWVTKFCFILELSDGMRDLFDTPKARYESAMSLCQMENPDRASVALVVANAIANLVKDGEKVRGVDAANLSRYALDELTRVRERRWHGGGVPTRVDRGRSHGPARSSTGTSTANGWTCTRRYCASWPVIAQKNSR